MKRRLLMVVFSIVAIFAVENAADIIVSRYVEFEFELGLWIVIAAICAFIVHEIGEDRGDW